MKILIVDDSDIVRVRLLEMLSELDEIERIEEARDVPEAIEIIFKRTPDVIILDIKMPNGSGLDVLKAVKDAQLDTAVIVLTNYPFPQYRKRFKNGGAQFFFDKSSEFEKIIGALKQLQHNSKNSDKKG